MKKIVVTGALGHIGSKLIRELPSLIPNSEIILIDNLMTQRFCSLFNLPENGNYTFNEENILTADLYKLFNDADAVVHLAAITNATSSFDNSEKVEETNFHGTKLVATACAELNVPLLFFSTTSVYGTQANVVDESCSDDELKPQSPYAVSKLKAEKMLFEMGEKFNLHFVILRFGTIYGTSVGMRFHTAVNKFCWQAVMRKPLTVWQTALHQKRPYLELSDAVNAIGFLIGNKLYNKEVYNVLTGNHTVNNIIDTIKLFRPDLQINYVDQKIMNQLSYEVMCDKFKDLGFSFHGNIQNNIKATIELFSSLNSTNLSTSLTERSK